MQENDLCTAISAFLTELLKDYPLPTSAKGDSDEDNWTEQPVALPKIVDGYLPPKRSESVQDFPCVLVRLQSSVTEREMTTATVLIACCVYSKKTEGYRHAVNLACHIRNALLGIVDNALAKRYLLEVPINLKNYDDQAWPYWQVDLTTTWKFRAPAINTPYLGKPQQW